MKPNPLDDRNADRLLSGAVTPDGAPAGYERVAELFSAARPQPAAMASAQEAATVAALRAAILQQPLPPLATPRKKNVLAKVLTAKAAVAAAALMLTAGTAAAATGSLPDSAQNAASTALSKVGISVPDGHGQSSTHKSDKTDTSTTETTEKAGTDTPTTAAGPNSHADFGLCNADAKNADHSNATVFPSKTTCSTVTHPGNADNANGQSADHQPTTTVSTSSDASTNGQSHKPATTGKSDATPSSTTPSTPAEGTAKVTTPNHGDAATTTTSVDTTGKTTGSTASSSGAENAGSHGKP